jgi:hypothetical protein
MSGITDYGFEWDNVEVIRTSELPDGHKVITIKTPRRSMDLYISRTGLIRVFTAPGDEWRPNGRKEPHGRRPR